MKVERMVLAALLIGLAVAPGAYATPTSTMFLPFGDDGPEDAVCANVLDASDVSGDGRDELLVTCIRDSELAHTPMSIHAYALDSASGTFARTRDLPAPPGVLGCSSIDAGDLDDDGRVDVVVSCYGLGSMPSAAYVSMQESNGSFAPFERLPPPVQGTDASRAWCSRAAVGDVLGSTRADVIVECAAGVYLYEGIESGSGFAAPLLFDVRPGRPIRACGQGRAVDVNGDGRSDLVATCVTNDGVADESTLTVAGLRGADGAIASVVALSLVPQVRCDRGLATGDLRGDAAPDVVVGCLTARRAFAASASLGGGTAGAGTIGGTGQYTATLPWASARCSSISVGTLARFGSMERAAAIGCPELGTGGGVLVYDARPKAARLVDVVVPHRQLGRTCGSVIATGDFDGDGRSDIAMACSVVDEALAITDASNHVAVAFGARAMEPSPLDDVLTGTSARDRIDGARGMDLIDGRAGNDDLRGGAGDDVVDGGAGHDRIRGDAGDDVLRGGPGNDVIDARGHGFDVVSCGQGRDRAIVDRRDRVRGCERVTRR